MKLKDIFEGDVIPFKQKAQGEQPNLSSIHDLAGVEGAEDELGELVAYFGQAVKNFTGNKMVIYKASHEFHTQAERYQDAQDEEDFPTMDDAFDKMEAITQSLSR